MVRRGSGIWIDFGQVRMIRYRPILPSDTIALSLEISLASKDLPPSFESLLDSAQSYLRDLVRHQGSGLLRFESLEDLVQGINQRALLSAPDFIYQGEAAFRGWLSQLARRQIADRHDYWTALRRGSGKVLRLTFGGGSQASVPLPPAGGTGPGTVASRKELLILAARALSALPARDQQFVRWMSEQVPVAEQAEKLGLSYSAAQRAGLRAVERFRKAFRIASQSQQ